VDIGASYGTLPTALRPTMSYAFASDVLGDPIDPVTRPWAAINNARITLSFRPATADDEAVLLALLPEGEITDLSQLPASIPAYLVNVVPELRIDGELVKTGVAMKLGEELEFVFQVKTPLQEFPPYTYRVPAGAYLAIATVGQNVGIDDLTGVQARLEATKAVLESGDETAISGLGREELLGDMFHAGVLGYFAQYTALGHVLALQQRAGHTLALGYGSFGYEPNVNYLFGIPRTLTPGGAVFNIRVGDFAATNGVGSESLTRFRFQLGLMSSSLEHAVPEQMFVTPENPGEAISAVKALAKAQAQAQGQRIYRITQANQASALPTIRHDQATMDEIRAAVAVGKEVITHTDGVAVPGWTGAGYIVVDSETGIGVYKISGGANGGFLGSDAPGLLYWFFVTVASLAIISVGAMFTLASVLIIPYLLIVIVSSVLLTEIALNLVSLVMNAKQLLSNCSDNTFAIAVLSTLLVASVLIGIASAIASVAWPLVVAIGLGVAIIENVIINLAKSSPRCRGA
jgi:hypothetical protein